MAHEFHSQQQWTCWQEEKEEEEDGDEEEVEDEQESSTNRQPLQIPAGPSDSLLRRLFSAAGAAKPI